MFCNGSLSVLTLSLFHLHCVQVDLVPVMTKQGAALLKRAPTSLAKEIYCVIMIVVCFINECTPNEMCNFSVTHVDATMPLEHFICAVVCFRNECAPNEI